MLFFCYCSYHHTFAVVVDECNIAKLVWALFWVTVENPTVVKACKSSSHHFFRLWPLQIESRCICTKNNTVVFFDAQLNAISVTLSRNAGEAEMISRCGPIRGHGEIHDSIWKRTYFIQINAIQSSGNIWKTTAEMKKTWRSIESKHPQLLQLNPFWNLFCTDYCLCTLKPQQKNSKNAGTLEKHPHSCVDTFPPGSLPLCALLNTRTISGNKEDLKPPFLHKCEK